MAKGKNKGKKKDKLAASDQREQKNMKKVEQLSGPTEAAPEKAQGTNPSSVESLKNCEMPSEEMLYDLADLFKVFADTTRIKILYALMGGDMCVADIAEAVDVSQSAVSHQLRSMKQAHLVKFRRDGKQIIYSLSDDHVHTMLAQGLTHICE